MVMPFDVSKPRDEITHVKHTRVFISLTEKIQNSGTTENPLRGKLEIDGF